MYKKVLALVLSFAMVFVLGVTAFAADQVGSSPANTTAVYEKTGYYYDTTGSDASGNHNNATGYDYKFTTPATITIGSAGATITITGVNAETVTLSAPATVTVRDSNGSGSNQTTANVTFNTLTFSPSITAEHSVSGNISAAFGNGQAPLAKGSYSGPIVYLLG